MQQSLLISIIIPVYNILDYLPRCVDSVCRQTYKNLEIILVDDGSTDGTGQLCDELAAKDIRIKVFHKENGGSSSARNLGLKMANGEYIGFVDSDDYISQKMYELLLSAILEYNVSIAQIGRDEIDAEGNFLPNICEPPTKTEVISSNDFMKELLMHRGDCSFCTKLVKKELFQKAVFPEGILNEDFYLLIHFLPELTGIVSLPCQMYHVFYRVGSNSRRKDKEDFSRVYGDSVDNAGIVEKIVKETYPNLKEVSVRFGLFQRLEYLLHIPISQMTKGNVQYQEICRYLKKHWKETIKSKYLTRKNKLYLLLFTIMPRGIRIIHKKIKKMK